MEPLFCCRNCIHNSGQSLNIGPGAGFCIKHDSILFNPHSTTCKYLHRKDLPSFVVDEGVREHAAEFATFSSLVDMSSLKPLARILYSEKYAWEKHIFDPVTHSLAQYHKSKPSWVFVQAFTGGLDGRRSLVYSGLIRRYMDHCGTWASSYRLVLALVKEMDVEPIFSDANLVLNSDLEIEDVKNEALWDVVFSRIALLQEYGFHSGIEDLMWASDALNGGLSCLDWSKLKDELKAVSEAWVSKILSHAIGENVFFPEPEQAICDEVFG